MTQGEITLRNLVSMTNGVVGLSILAMPYCFEQCGLILATIALLFSSFMTAYSCKLIIKTIEITKTKSFEFLALRVFGHKGKLLIEICIILLLYGSLVTNQQALCETGPAFITKLFNIQGFVVNRAIFMLFFTIIVSLPLSLSKKLEGLHSISACAILFYFSFGLYLMWEASYKMSDSKWIKEINLWKFSGLLKCFPIFSISYSCQTILYVVYDELEDKTVIRRLADSGIFIAFVCYFMAGFFGYIAYYDVSIHGNILTNIPETFMSQIILFGFIICVISGFPFMIFPCRTSLNTLFFSTENEILESELFIPEHRFKYLTYIIVLVTTSTAVLVPNMEFVLSLTGATAGSLTSYVWPSLLYIFVKGNMSNFQRVSVNIFLTLGITILFVCTIAALIEYKPTQEFAEMDTTKSIDSALNKMLEDTDNKKPNNIVHDSADKEQVRQEPPNPDYDVHAKKLKRVAEFFSNRPKEINRNSNQESNNL